MVHTSLKIRECCGANSFACSTVDLSKFNIPGRHGEHHKRSPDCVAELDELLRVGGIERELFRRLDKNTVLESAAPEHHGAVYVRVPVNDALCEYKLFNHAVENNTGGVSLPSGIGFV